MISSKWLVLAATLVIVPPVVQAQTATTPPAEGALPIMAGQEIVGAIGVSSAPGGDKDAACAQVGIDRIAKGLGS
jgi:uncharacterized protein GlcG (DUF336 family)